jgi:dUTP pyrophosphatase
MHIRIINHSKHALPAYATADASGMDLRANIDASITLQPLQRVLVGTGLYMALPKGYEAQVRPRSGLAFKHGLTVLNSPGTIDADYRGEIKVMLINLSEKAFIIEDGERIAQLVVAAHSRVLWAPVVALDDTPRGQGGFGSTGVQ